MTGSGDREVEAKFRVHATFELPSLAGRAGVARADGPVVQELRAVYWDTSDLRLAREGITLRHRRGEGDGDGWHLKLPVQEAGIPDTGIGARDEIHELAPDTAVPDILSDLITVYVRGAVLGPVATLATHRSVFRLRGDNDEVLAVLTDDVVSVLSERHVAARFREIEVEDAGGGIDVLSEVGRSLRTVGAVAGEFVPKVVRALGPQATADPDPPLAATIDLDQPTRNLVQSILRRYVRVFMTRDVEVRRGQADGVHQMRVAARRIRSCLKTFRPVLDPQWADALREELAWVADDLGVARDAEVLLARLLGQLDDLRADLVVGPVRARIESTVGGDLARGTATTAEVLRSERYLALFDRLVDAAWDPLTTPEAMEPLGIVVPRLVDETWRRLAKRARRVRHADATDDDWHSARIAAKQARYVLESVAPTYGRPAKRLAEQAEAVQELLGAHQDAVVACDVLRGLATGSRGGSVAFTAGLLYARQLDEIARTRREFDALWRHASARKLREWLKA